jgi:hypothetical protein
MFHPPRILFLGNPHVGISTFLDRTKTAGGEDPSMPTLGFTPVRYNPNCLFEKYGPNLQTWLDEETRGGGIDKIALFLDATSSSIRETFHSWIDLLMASSSSTLPPMIVMVNKIDRLNGASLWQVAMDKDMQRPNIEYNVVYISGRYDDPASLLRILLQTTI